MKIGLVGAAMAASIVGGLGRVGAAVESISAGARNDLHLKAEEARRSGRRTRSRIPGKPGVAGNKLARKAGRGTLTLRRGRRGLLGRLGRVVA